MTLVREICDHIYVLDFGVLIFEGTPEEMHLSDEVRAAYLGDCRGRRRTPIRPLRPRRRVDHAGR